MKILTLSNGVVLQEDNNGKRSVLIPAQTLKSETDCEHALEAIHDILGFVNGDEGWENFE